MRDCFPNKYAEAHKAGATRQYLSRLGKVDLPQVRVALVYYQDNTWAILTAEAIRLAQGDNNPARVGKAKNQKLGKGIGQT